MVVRSIISAALGTNQGDPAEEDLDHKGTRDLLVSLLSRAGKGKDEVVQIIAREIGTAVAAMLKKPLNELAQTHRLKITLELTPKHEEKETEPAQKRSPRRKHSSKKPA